MEVTLLNGMKVFGVRRSTGKFELGILTRLNDNEGYIVPKSGNGFYTDRGTILQYRPESGDVCPNCFSETTKIASGGAGKYECQICGHEYDEPKIITNKNKNL